MFYTQYSKIDDFFARKGLLRPLGVAAPCLRLRASLPLFQGTLISAAWCNMSVCPLPRLRQGSPLPGQRKSSSCPCREAGNMPLARIVPMNGCSSSNPDVISECSLLLFASLKFNAS